MASLKLKAALQILKTDPSYSDSFNEGCISNCQVWNLPAMVALLRKYQAGCIVSQEGQYLHNSSWPWMKILKPQTFNFILVVYDQESPFKETYNLQFKQLRCATCVGTRRCPPGFSIVVSRSVFASLLQHLEIEQRGTHRFCMDTCVCEMYTVFWYRIYKIFQKMYVICNNVCNSYSILFGHFT